MIDVLTIFGQRYYHDDAVICGSRMGFLKLSYAAIIAALFGRKTIKTFSDDGEGYDLSLAVSTENLGNQYIDLFDGHVPTCGIDVASKLKLGAYKK